MVRRRLKQENDLILKKSKIIYIINLLIIYMSKSNLTAKSIIKTLELNKSDIKSFNVKKIGLFGSFLKDKQSKKSDIDFIVSFSKPSFDNYMELKFFLEKKFKKKIDLVTEKAIKPRLKYVKGEALYARF